MLTNSKLVTRTDIHDKEWMRHYGCRIWCTDFIDIPISRRSSGFNYSMHILSVCIPSQTIHDKMHQITVTTLSSHWWCQKQISACLASKVMNALSYQYCNDISDDAICDFIDKASSAFYAICNVHECCEVVNELITCKKTLAPDLQHQYQHSCWIRALSMFWTVRLDVFHTMQIEGKQVSPHCNRITAYLVSVVMNVKSKDNPPISFLLDCCYQATWDDNNLKNCVM